MTEETPTTDSPQAERNQAEIVANPAFIKWKYPPYCELCNVLFSGEQPSKTHFEGNGHKNRLQIWKKYQNPELQQNNSKTVLCRICWKEMNTQLILDTHCTSPAHLKEEKQRLIIKKLKQDYIQLKNEMV